VQKILINGQWREATAVDSFQAFNPQTGEKLSETYPVSAWRDCDAALDAATRAFQALQALPQEKLAAFLEDYAARIEANAANLAEAANLETGLAVAPRLRDVELPRTCNQLRQAARAVRESSWREATIDSQLNIRSMRAGIGPVAVFGPNNFPLAFGSISGGDFAAAIAAGNPVIAKAHPSHPATTRLFAELAQQAADVNGLPAGSVQLLYAMENESGLKLVSDPRIAATGFTGSRGAGLALKAAADGAGKLIYLELSSVNPVVLLPGAIAERGDTIAEEFTNSCLVAAGQLCTKPGLLVVEECAEADAFVSLVAQKFSQGTVATLLSPQAAEHILNTSSHLVAAGATLLTNQSRDAADTGRFCHANTLMSVSGDSFVADSDTFQTEIFGNASLIIRSSGHAQTLAIIERLEGNLTGCIYSHSDGRDDSRYDAVANQLLHKVGRLLNDKMPTGVAVSAAMNHGGPFPSSGHPGFTAVGLPAAIKRFSALKCFDNVRAARLPGLLRDVNPDGKTWRLIDGNWTQAAVASQENT